MTRLRRPLLFALLALVAPLPAFALPGTGSAPGLAALSVSASFGGCGLADTQIVCRIDAGWDEIEGADSYTVSVTGADGSVVDYGYSAAGGTTLWVPYVGSGSYSVQVTAWGTPPDAAAPEVVARDSAAPAEDAALPQEGDAASGESPQEEPEAPEPAPGGEDAASGGGEEDTVEQPVAPPECDPAAEHPAEPQPRDDGDDAAPEPGATAAAQDVAALSTETREALETTGEAPEAVVCP